MEDLELAMLELGNGIYIKEEIVVGLKYIWENELSRNMSGMYFF